MENRDDHPLLLKRPGQNGPVTVQVFRGALPGYARGTCPDDPARTVVRLPDATIDSYLTESVSEGRVVPSQPGDTPDGWGSDRAEIMKKLLAHTREMLSAAEAARKELARAVAYDIPSDDAWAHAVRANMHAFLWSYLAHGIDGMPGLTEGIRWVELCPLLRRLRSRAARELIRPGENRATPLGADVVLLTMALHWEQMEGYLLFLAATDEAAWRMTRDANNINRKGAPHGREQ